MSATRQTPPGTAAKETPPGTGSDVVQVGWIFATVPVARIYWAFAGNRWARWDQFLPIRRDRRRLIRPSIEWYLFRRLKAPPVTGHNPLASATYLVLFGMFALEAITGFALEALDNPTA